MNVFKWMQVYLVHNIWGWRIQDYSLSAESPGSLGRRCPHGGRMNSKRDPKGNRMSGRLWGQARAAHKTSSAWELVHSGRAAQMPSKGGVHELMSHFSELPLPQHCHGGEAPAMNTWGTTHMAVGYPANVAFCISTLFSFIFWEIEYLSNGIKV